MILRIVEHVWESVKVVSPGIEMLVLLLIAFEVYVGIKERRREHRRKRLVDERVSEMRKAMAAGQVLVLSNPQSDDPRVAGWAQAVSNWSEETRRLLKSYSEHAETAFMLRMPSSPSSYGSRGAVFEYISLLSGLENLKGIIEKPGVYF
jgi:hypothetical protein